MIITRLGGGMGNQMFQYAIGRSLAVKNSTSLGLYLDALLDRSNNGEETFRNFDLDVYNIKAEIVSRSKVPIMYKYYNKGVGDFFLRGIRFLLRRIFRVKMDGKENSNGFDESILSLGRNAYLEGGWQSEKYFIDIAEIIKDDFKLKTQLTSKIKELMNTIKRENSLCMHVRRGDYVNDKNFEVVNNEYYDNALNYISKKTKIDKIYVFSDDIKWCKENIKFENPTMFVGEEYSGIKAEGHHVLMRSCKNFIIPNSTYSWWAAWLSDRKDKIVIVPKKWFPDESIHSKKCIDIVPSDWIRI
jgi:hypothetical protein